MGHYFRVFLMWTRWVTFDCFGTLVDWHTGFSALLRPFAGDTTAPLLRAYHRFEREVQAERPFRRYREVLITTLGRAAKEVGFELNESQAASLARQWGSLPVFGDVEEALASMRTAGCKIAVLTNCDEDLFEETERSFCQPFDFVITAERVRDYKPALSHFRFFEQQTRVDPADWVHVACSWFHDIAPARELGIKRVWLDRDRTGHDATAASLRVLSATDLPRAVIHLFESRL
jgi:2-haloacid dehalogenase